MAQSKTEGPKPELTQLKSEMVSSEAKNLLSTFKTIFAADIVFQEALMNSKFAEPKFLLQSYLSDEMGRERRPPVEFEKRGSKWKVSYYSWDSVRDLTIDVADVPTAQFEHMHLSITDASQNGRGDSQIRIGGSHDGVNYTFFDANTNRAVDAARAILAFYLS